MEQPEKCGLCGRPFTRPVRRADDPARWVFGVGNGDLTIAHVLPGEAQAVRVHLRCSAAERVDAAKHKAN